MPRFRNSKEARLCRPFKLPSTYFACHCQHPALTLSHLLRHPIRSNEEARLCQLHFTLSTPKLKIHQVFIGAGLSILLTSVRRRYRHHKGDDDTSWKLRQHSQERFSRRFHAHFQPPPLRTFYSGTPSHLESFFLPAFRHFHFAGSPINA